MKLFYSTILISLVLAFLLQSCSISLYQHGKNSLESNDFTNAETTLLQVTEANPSDQDAWRDLGIAQYKLQKFDLAEKSLLNAYNPHDGETLFYLGLLSEAKENPDKAIQYYKESLALDLDDEILSKIEGRICLIERNKMENEIRTALANETTLSSEPIPANTIAVLLFQNLGDKKELDPLQKGLAEMIITDLSKVHDLKIVERLKLQRLIDEMNLSSGVQFDQSTAPRFGKLIKAETLIKGTFMNLEAEKLRMNANFIATKDGSYKTVKDITGSIQDYFTLQKDLVFSIIDDMGITLTDAEREAIKIIPTENFLSFVAYCKGLDYEDRGMYSEASGHFTEAVSLDPSFKAAGVKLNETKNLNDAQSKFENTGESIRSAKSGSTMDRLSDSNLNLTGENITGKDDRNPNTTAGFGRGVKVQIEIKLNK